MNHPQKGIFTPVRNQVLTGRNANIQPTMFKRKEIFQKVSTERSQPPFSGYSFTGSSVTDNCSLARSQVSEISQQSFARLFRQHMQKNGMNTQSETSEQSIKYKNELNIMRIEIRGVKQSYHEFNKAFKKRLQDQNDIINQLKKQISNQCKQNSQIRDDISAQMIEKIQQVQQGIAVKMRVIFTKLQQDLRKELTNYANREFVPTSFLDDLDKQLNELDDRIANIQNQNQANKNKGNKENMTGSKIDRDSSIFFSSGSELKLKQFQRDLSNLKKQLDEKSELFREIQNSILAKNQTHSKQFKQLKSSVFQLSSAFKDRLQDYQGFKSTLQAKIEIDKKKLYEKIQTDFEILTKKLDQDIAIKSLALSSSIEPDNFKKKIQSSSLIIVDHGVDSQNQSKFEQTMDESKASGISSCSKLNSEIITNNQTQLRTSPSQNNQKKLSPIGNDSIVNSKDSPKKTKKITITYGGSEKVIQPAPDVQAIVGSSPPQNLASPKIGQPIENVKKEQQIKTLYKVDKQGYLMDMRNKYLLSQSNTMIFVSDKQIEAMQSTGLIKVERWVSS